VVHHMQTIKRLPGFEASRFIIYVERNLGFEAGAHFFYVKFSSPGGMMENVPSLSFKI
jgi:hypothetical protein